MGGGVRDNWIRVRVLLLIALKAWVAQERDQLTRPRGALRLVGHRFDQVKDDLLNGIAGR